VKIQDVLKELNIPIAPETHHHTSPGWINIDCPWCTKNTHRYRLGINLAGNYASCWACGSKLLGEVIHEITELPWNKIKDLLRGVERQVLPNLPKARGKLVVPLGIGELLPCHCNYLERRGFNKDNLERLWKVKGIGLHNRLAWRIFIPIVFQGEVVSWTTRSVSDEGQRYWSAKQEEEVFPHKDLLYGEDYVRHTIIVHEGPTDVWRTGPGAVATLGTSYSRAQIRRMANHAVRVVCFDSEPMAQRRATHLCDLLDTFPGSTYNVVLSGKDAASSPLDEIQELRKRFLDDN
jgi:hypothetical protein